jgi:hypothetical protein
MLTNNSSPYSQEANNQLDGDVGRGRDHGDSNQFDAPKNVPRSAAVVPVMEDSIVDIPRVLSAPTSYFFPVLRDLAPGCTPAIYSLADVIFLILRSIQDPLSLHGDTAGSATQGRICRCPFGDVGDRGLMFRDYLALQVGLSLEAIVRSLKFPLR